MSKASEAKKKDPLPFRREAVKRMCRSARQHPKLSNRALCQGAQFSAVPSMGAIQRNPLREKSSLPVFYKGQEANRATNPKSAEELILEIRKRNFVGWAYAYEAELPLLAFIPIVEFGAEWFVWGQPHLLANLCFNQRPKHTPNVFLKRTTVCQIVGSWVASMRASLQPRKNGEQRILDQIAAGSAPQTVSCQMPLSEFTELPFCPLVHGNHEFKTTLRIGSRQFHDAIGLTSFVFPFAPTAAAPCSSAWIPVARRRSRGATLVSGKSDFAGWYYSYYFTSHIQATV
jgi:hypothetical protein